MYRGVIASPKGEAISLKDCFVALLLAMTLYHDSLTVTSIYVIKIVFLQDRKSIPIYAFMFQNRRDYAYGLSAA